MASQRDGTPLAPRSNIFYLIMAIQFYKSNCSDDVVVKVVDGGQSSTCDNQTMTLLEPNTTDAAGEKHVPVVTRVDDQTIKVEVGSVAHPMLPNHHIAFVYVETERGGVRVDLKDEPQANICVGNEKVVAVYEYCNLHGLWKTTL